MARINLLPWRETLRKQKQQELMIMAGFALLVSAAGMGYWHLYSQGEIEFQQRRNSFLKSEIANVESKIKEIEQIEKNKAQLVARMNVIQSLQRSRPQIVHLMDELVETLPEGSHIMSLEQSNSVVSITGRAQSNARVSAYMRNIERSEWLASPNLKEIEAKEQDQPGTAVFGLVVQQVAPGEEAAKPEN